MECTGRSTSVPRLRYTISRGGFFEPSFRFFGMDSKLIVRDLTGRHVQLPQNLERLTNHHRRSAEIKLHIPQVLVFLKIFRLEHFVNEPGMRIPMVLRLRFRERQMVAE